MSSCLFICRRRRRAHAEPWSEGELLADDVNNGAGSLGPHMIIAEVGDTWRMPEVEGRSTARGIEGETTEIFGDAGRVVSIA